MTGSAHEAQLVAQIAGRCVPDGRVHGGAPARRISLRVRAVQAGCGCALSLIVPPLETLSVS
jgi:hypothetical protein